MEAQASGKPVIAFRAGGALETVIEGQTGLFFDEQTPESLAEAVQRFEREAMSYELGAGSSELKPFSAARCRANAEKYRPERFRAEIKAFLELHYPDLFSGYDWPV
ncbi:MAG: glycosyltransferase [Opitutus sp.]|nr:glycosyltransferase [Opitutus sp.]MCS6277664.1 glycosyltransferase [Opitutus sp.]MCS6300782.1 glycosyltransferase [Opitutus sp.]